MKTFNSLSYPPHFQVFVKSSLVFLCMMLFVYNSGNAQGGPPNTIGQPSNPGSPHNTYWNLNGNTLEENQYLGSTNAIPLIFKTNDEERFRIDENGQIILPDFANLGKGLLYSDNGNLTLQAFTGEKDHSLRADGTFAPVTWMRVGDDIYSLNEGRVGIGTTEPLAKLHVAGGDVFFENEVFVGDRITVLGRVRADDTLRMEAGYLRASCAETELGNRVGIGRPPHESLRLAINGNTLFQGDATIGNRFFLPQIPEEQDEDFRLMYVNKAGEVKSANLHHITDVISQVECRGLEDGGPPPPARWVSNNNIIYADYCLENAKVGIGTETPKERLHLHRVSENPIHMKFTNEHTDQQNDGFKMGISEYGAFEMIQEHNSEIRFMLRGTDMSDPVEERMRIMNNGNVGIGTDSPLNRFHVFRAKNTDGNPHNYEAYTAYIQNSGGTGGGLRIRAGSNVSDGFPLLIQSGPIDSPMDIVTVSSRGKMTVSGLIEACEILVDEDEWCDYVFEEDYALMSLYELEQYIKENKHLPDIPSETQIKEVGHVKVGEMQKLHMKKIEELTLYIITLQKQLDELNKEMVLIKSKNK